VTRASTAWLGTAIALPLAYAGSLLAVLVHEAIGHGAVAALLGGRFVALVVRLDLMGYATTVMPPTGRVAVLAGGIVSTALAGALGVVLARRVRSPVAGLALGVLAVAFLHEGLPYAVWNSAMGAGGDVGRLLRIVGPGARAWVLPLAIVAYVVGTYAGHAALFRRAEDVLGPLSRGWAFGVAGGTAVVVAAGYLAFDWEPLLGRPTVLPAVGALALGLAVAAVLVARRRREVPGDGVPARRLARAAVLAWIATAALAGAVALWLEDGLTVS
jgi:hypothetical protein